MGLGGEPEQRLKSRQRRPNASSLQLDGLTGRVLYGRPQARQPVFAEATKPTGKTFRDDPVWANRSRYQCVRTGRWKYARRDPDELEHLFDLSEDPGELNDLLAAGPVDAQLPSNALPGLRSELESWLSAASSGGRAEVLESPGHAEALRALGYVDDE